MITEVCLVGVLIIWLTTSSGAHPAYGRSASVALLTLSILLTFVVAAAAFIVSGIPTWARSASAALLAVTGGAVAPIAITDLLTGQGDGILLVLAVAGMEVVAVRSLQRR